MERLSKPRHHFFFGFHRSFTFRRQFYTAVCILVLALSACTTGSAKRHYIVAEKLWSDGKYEAAVDEFEQVIRRDPDGEFGRKALFRAAMTEMIFLQRYVDALFKFQSFVEKSLPSSVHQWSAQVSIGEIFYTHLRRYRRAIRHYQYLVEHHPNKKDVPQFLYRIARSHFFLWNFDESIAVYEKLIARYPESEFVEKAEYEIGMSLFTSGEQTPGGHGPGMKVYQQAIQQFQSFIRKYPESNYRVQAQFGIAACLEEMDQLQQAYEQYQKIESIYPSPNVVKIKLIRIQERLAQRARPKQK